MKLKSKKANKIGREEIRLSGASICSGIAIGKPFYLDAEMEISTPELDLNDDDIEREIKRYRNALDISQQELLLLKIKLEDEKAWEGAAILESHLQMMQDPLITTGIEQQIRAQRKNTEAIFKATIDEYQKIFDKIPNQVFKERFRDIQDIASRVMRHLNCSSKPVLTGILTETILFVRELAPSVTAEINEHIVGFVTKAGGITSHAAIMAKARGVPYVANIDLPIPHELDIEFVILDGESGEVILNPFPETLQFYREKRDLQRSCEKTLKDLVEFKTETMDGYLVTLSANMEMNSEVEMVHENGGSGVGLFRSESLFLSQDGFPAEDEQFQVYKKVILHLAGLPLVIRTFDIGGDKSAGLYYWKDESNPFLGCRAIRLMLREREVFKTQLRAILRASAFGPVSILFPMISGIAELREAKGLIEEVKLALLASGVRVSSKIRIGCMIEVPSAALICDMLAKECDFLSIGTNDLVQYSLAVDRGNQSVSYLYSPAHPSVIRLIKMVVTEANHYGIPVTVCGEIAADARYTAILLGLGVHELSVHPRYLATVKRAIRQLSIIDAMQLADRALTLCTVEEIEALIYEEFEERYKKYGSLTTVPVVYQ